MCGAFANQTQNRYPVPKPKRALPKHQAWMLLIRDPEGAVLLEQRPSQGIWGGLWSLPQASSEDELRSRFAEHDLEIQPEPRQVEHSFSHYQLQMNVLQARTAPVDFTVRENDNLLWYQQGHPVGLPAPVKKLIELTID